MAFKNPARERLAEIQRTIAKRIRERRLELRLTQNDLAVVTNMDSTSWSRVERAERKLSLPEAAQAAMLLEIDVGYLVRDEPKDVVAA